MKELTFSRKRISECGGECESCARFACKKTIKSELMLVKKKVSTKFVPPDASLLKLIMGDQLTLGIMGTNVTGLTDDELDAFEKELVKNYLNAKN